MQFSSGSSEETTSRGSHESEDAHFVRAPPLGPLSAFDLFEDHLVFFEEKRNRVIVMSEDNESDSIVYSIPPEYSFGKYYWASIHFVDSSTLICLLKHHTSRLFSLLTFELNDEKKSCKLLNESLTDISIDGYQIWSQRGAVDGRFIYSFTHRKRPSKDSKKKKLEKSVSDRVLFKEQMLQVIEANSHATETKSLQPIVAHRRTVSTESEHPPSQEHPRLEDTVQTEVVMLEASVTMPSGRITHKVLSVGKRSVRLRVSTSGKRRAIGDSVRIQQMNRLSAPPISPPASSSSPSSSFSPTAISPPILLAGQAVFISKHSPSEAHVIPVKEGDTHGLLGAFVQRIRKPSSSRRVEPSLVSIEGTPPSGGDDAVWSDFNVSENEACVAVQDSSSKTSSSVSLWRLSVDDTADLHLKWDRLGSIPVMSSNDHRVSEMRLSLSSDNKACLRGSRYSSESSDDVSHFCMTFDRISLTA